MYCLLVRLKISDTFSIENKIVATDLNSKVLGSNHVLCFYFSELDCTYRYACRDFTHEQSCSLCSLYVIRVLKFKNSKLKSFIVEIKNKLILKLYRTETLISQTRILR